MSNLPTTTTTEHQTLHFMSYPDPGVPHWLAARIALHRDQLGAYIEFRPELTPRQQLRVHAWAYRALEEYLAADGSRFDTGRADHVPEDEPWHLYGPVLRAGDLDGIPGADVVCLDCSHLFNPDYSPHLDRCAGCAERCDDEAGR